MDNKQEINQEIDRPTHYGSKSGRDVIDIAEEFGFIDNAYVFNIFKYLIRAGRKRNNSVLQDALKARVYLDRFIDSIKKNVASEQNDSENSTNNVLKGDKLRVTVDDKPVNGDIAESVIKRATEIIDEANKELDKGTQRIDFMKNILRMSDSEINSILGKDINAALTGLFPMSDSKIDTAPVKEKKTSDNSNTNKKIGRYFSRSNI